MKFGASGLVLCLVVAGCGDGVPFNGDTTTTPGSGTSTQTIPATLSNNLESFAYNATTQTLSITGITADDSQFTSTYRRRPLLDRGGYQAYTAQDGSLDRHVTAYVKDINGTQAGVVVTGGQFQGIFSGTGYANASYTAPVQPGTQAEGGVVTYAGKYVGLLNTRGSGEDLTAVAAGTPTAPLPVQAAEVTGDIVLTGDFNDAAVDGLIYQRKVLDYDNTTSGYAPNAADPLQVNDIALDSTAIATDGTFSGTTSQANITVGEYAGIFGGVGATEVAGVIRAENHIDQFDEEVEYGAFVLAQCGQPDEDPICAQPTR